jgi:hypothetical protein
MASGALVKTARIGLKTAVLANLGGFQLAESQTGEGFITWWCGY